MAAKIICDGCGKEEDMVAYAKYSSGQWEKPPSWFQRSDKDGIQDACSRECIEIVAKKTNKTALVAPF